MQDERCGGKEHTIHTQTPNTHHPHDYQYTQEGYDAIEEFKEYEWIGLLIPEVNSKTQSMTMLPEHLLIFHKTT